MDAPSSALITGVFKSLIKKCKCRNPNHHETIPYESANEILDIICKHRVHDKYWRYINLINANIVFFSCDTITKWVFLQDIANIYLPFLKLHPLWFENLFIGEIGEYSCELYGNRNFNIKTKTNILFHIILMKDSIILDISRIIQDYMDDTDSIPEDLIHSLRYILTDNKVSFKVVRSKLVYTIKSQKEALNRDE